MRQYARHVQLVIIVIPRILHQVIVAVLKVSTALKELEYKGSHVPSAPSEVDLIFKVLQIVLYVLQEVTVVQRLSQHPLVVALQVTIVLLDHKIVKVKRALRLVIYVLQAHTVQAVQVYLCHVYQVLLII